MIQTILVVVVPRPRSCSSLLLPSSLQSPWYNSPYFPRCILLLRLRPTTTRKFPSSRPKTRPWMQWISSTILASDELSSCRNSGPGTATEVVVTSILFLVFVLSVQQHRKAAAYWQIRTRPSTRKVCCPSSRRRGRNGRKWDRKDAIRRVSWT